MSKEAGRAPWVDVRVEAVPVVRIKLSDERAPVREDDPRSVVGFRRGLSTDELWDRGRQDWALHAQRVVECDLLLIAHAGMIRLVGTVEGIRKTGTGRLTIEGTPLPDHPLVGQRDPLDNDAASPYKYGRVTLPR